MTRESRGRYTDGSAHLLNTVRTSRKVG